MLGIFALEFDAGGTHEIDIEFAQWGNSTAPSGNYTVWPTTTSVRQESKSFPFTLNGDASTHSFTWSPTNVFFQSQHVRSDDSRHQFTSWLYQPPNPGTGLSQNSMPVHINFWCFKGHPPSDGHQVELIVRAFKFTPM